MKVVIFVNEYRNELFKFVSSEFGLLLNVSDRVISSMEKYVQKNTSIPESGGVLLGYRILGKNEIMIDDISLPDKYDERSLIKFIRKSVSHIIKINSSNEKKSFCIGNWHTHPCCNPVPSSIDLKTWKEELMKCSSTFGFQVFIICAIDGFDIWVGKEKTGKIVKCIECKKKDGIYIS